MRRATLALMAVWMLAPAALVSADDEPLTLESMGVMYVGGREVAMQSVGGRRGGGGRQTQIVEQAPVHYLIPTAEARDGKTPVIMVPGMGLTSWLYLGTPDGREGWAQIFARGGHPVYVLDVPNQAVAGFGVGPFNAAQQGQAEAASQPRFMLWSNEMVWRRWGIGPEPAVPFEDTQYPVEQIEQLYASMTPVCMTGGGRSGDGAGAAALVELLEQVGPAALVLHSASGELGFAATRTRPDLVTAIVAVEVTGAPSDEGDIRDHFADKVFLGLFGDHFEVRPMDGRHEACETAARLIAENGGTAEVIRLTDLDIRGNTHLMMQDANNDEIAAMILQRLVGGE